MEFRIADTFLQSLARLTGDEQKAVKTTAFDLQRDPVNPGMGFHRLDHAKDKNFWSVRVGSDLRLIVHRNETSLLLCYVDHHDRAYQWAERRKLETHPTTGAAQFVEIHEVVKEVVVPRYVEAPVLRPSKGPPLKGIADDELLAYGVPPAWLKDVREAEVDALLALAYHLPSEAAEAVLLLADGKKPERPVPAKPGEDPFVHPDAQRRFRRVQDDEELKRAFEYPWDRWMVFLHPAQREWVARDYAGPARVSGSAGTGKTIVALHRAVHLARENPQARVLLTTFSENLANALRTLLRRLVSGEPRLAERVDVLPMDAVGLRLYTPRFGEPRIAAQSKLAGLLSAASSEVGGHKFTLPFLLAEWGQVVDAWQLETWEDYRDVRRLGRKTRLSEPARKILWSIFDRVRKGLAAENTTTHSGVFSRLAAALADGKNPPYDFAVVDEAQDLTVAHLKFLAALGRGRPNSLFFAGDLGQRIFQQPFSWKALGVEVQGRSRTLHVNYRTSHQIRTQADRLLGREISDADGNSEERRGTVSVFDGPAPVIQILKSIDGEAKAVGKWISERKAEGVAPHEIGVFVRSGAEIDRARAAVKAAGLPFQILDEEIDSANGQVAIGTMHLAKGLEFKAVAVMACDEDVIPQEERVANAGDDQEDAYNTERHLLYVACTRARDHLLVTGVEPASEFLDDIKANPS